MDGRFTHMDDYNNLAEDDVDLDFEKYGDDQGDGHTDNADDTDPDDSGNPTDHDDPSNPTDPPDTTDPTPRGFPGAGGGRGNRLVPLEVDMCLDMNMETHRTKQYPNDTLVVRRGTVVFVKVLFNRPIRPHDQFELQFRIGQSPNNLRGTQIPISFSGLNVSGPWRASATEQRDALMVQVTPSVDAVVGLYRILVGVARRRGLKIYKKLRQHMYLLFNAFHPSDEAFLGAEPDGYVMKTEGTIYTGSIGSIQRTSWKYGQFDQDILKACIYIMDQSRLPISHRGDAVKVIRMASAMLNSQDDGGVVVGNWGKDFTPHTSPLFWSGSVKILQTYLSTRRPVSYGQCWVFAGVMNTFLRCLGLGARVVSNFQSAHDNDGDLKMTIIVDENTGRTHGSTRDSIWNFHCWNEVFLRRSDIPPEFSGWQVVDCTPQETSDGYYRCGPASVKAIKIGKVCFPFDGRFIFAEVNSDFITYIRNKYGNLRLSKIDKALVGLLLLTENAQGQAINITLDYKHDEYSPQGKLANENALATAESYGCRREHRNVPPSPESVVIKIHQKEGYLRGYPVKVAVEILNESDVTVKAHVQILVETVFYTNISSDLVDQRSETVQLQPQQPHQITLNVDPEVYMKSLLREQNLKVVVSVRLPRGTVERSEAVVIMRDLELQLQVVPETPVEGKSSKAIVTFLNNLNVSLLQPEVMVDGPGLLQYTWSKVFHDVAPGQLLRAEVDFKALSPGSKRLTARMLTANDYIARGSLDVEVTSGWASPDLEYLPFRYLHFGGYPRSGGGD